MMNRQLTFRVTAVLIFLAYLWIYFAGMAAVPFHPDEATQIYMSSDVQAFFHSPASLFYDPAKPDDARQHYRLIDAPVTRTVIGLARWITNQPALLHDWNWSQNWDENQANGAFPNPTLLLVSRLSTGFLFPFALIAFYFTCRKFAGDWISLFAAVLLGLNGLILLHTRRAMAEGWLLSLYLVILWRCFSKTTLKNSLLIIVLMAILFQVKQTTAPFIMAVGCILLVNIFRKYGLKVTVACIAGMILLFGGIALLLNPVAWKDPVQVLALMVRQRFEFSQGQAQLFSRNQGGIALDTPGLRLLGILSQTFFSPPAYVDTGNYLKDLLPSIRQYSHEFLAVSLSGWVWGIIFIIFTILGMAFGFLKWVKKTASETIRYLFIITLVQVLFFTFFIGIGFQRYYVQFIPLFVIWSIIPLQQVVDLLSSKKQPVSYT
jgi:hypothetical protein